jgi:hypothetical protein
LETHLLGLLESDSLLLLGLLMLRLLSHDTTTPGSSSGNVVVVLSLEGLGEGLEGGDVFLSDRCQSDNGGVLLVNEGTESGLALDNAEWNILLSAQGWEPADELDWVNIVSNNDELGLLVLDEGGDLMDTVLDSKWLLLVTFLTGGLGLSDLLKADLLLLGGLWGVLVQELEELRSLVLVESVGELVDHWWNLNSLQKNLLLSLKSDVLWPSDISCQINSGLDVVADVVVSLDHN